MPKSLMNLASDIVSRDCVPTPVLVLVPAGEFLMGAGAGDKFANSTERPRVRIRIKGFAIGSFAVTVGEYRVFEPGHAPGDQADLPAVHVSWDNASEFCNWLATKSGKPYRLPSEAEWEYACRAGTDTPFYTGNSLDIADANYLYNETGTRIGRGERAAVGSYPGNRWGLHETHGNVSEWCADFWHPSHEHASLNGSPRRDAETPKRAIRGGSWDYLPRLLRSSWRDGLPPETRRDNLGFRVACSLPKAP